MSTQLRSSYDADTTREVGASAGSPTGPGAAGGGVRAWPLVAGREIGVRLTDKNFLISTLTTLVIMAAMFAFQGWTATKGSSTTIVTTTQSAADLGGRIGTAVQRGDEKNTVRVDRAGDDAAARRALESGGADVWLHEVGGAWTVTRKDDTPPSSFLAVTQQVVRDQVLERNAAQAGTTSEALMRGTQVSTDQLSGSGTEMMVRMIAGVVLAVLFYMISLLFGMAIAQSVVEEKQSRIVEIIASAIPLRDLLTGKVLGNTVLAFGQLMVFVTAGLIGLQFTPWKDFAAVIGPGVGWFVAFFVVAFVALACLWAVAGSLASRYEDLQMTSQPMMFAVMIAFFGGAFAQGTVKTVLSFVPITSGVAMPMRLLAGDVPVWEPIVALAINLAFAACAVAVGTQAYQRSILAGGGRVSWKDALTAKA